MGVIGKFLHRRIRQDRLTSDVKQQLEDIDDHRYKAIKHKLYFVTILCFDILFMQGNFKLFFFFCKLFCIWLIHFLLSHFFRPFFTYWVTTVQILVTVISLAVYGFGPFGVRKTQRSGEVSFHHHLFF